MYFTGSAGGDYDIAPYDVLTNPLTGYDHVLAAAQQWGHKARAGDVLDLGCGFGRQLAQAAEFTSGRLVGVDASRVTCEGARQVLAPWTDRARIHEANFEALGSDVLGTFDAIYCVGALYTVPADARAAVLATIRDCLRPGGLAIFTYYAGTRGLIHAAVEKYLRSLQTGGGTIAEALAQAREHLAAVQSFQAIAPHIPAVAQHVSGIAAFNDVVLAHEALGHGIEILNTAELDVALRPASIRFIGYLGFDASAFSLPSDARLYRAETLDLLDGGYRFALFARDND